MQKLFWNRGDGTKVGDMQSLSGKPEKWQLVKAFGIAILITPVAWLYISLAIIALD